MSLISDIPIVLKNQTIGLRYDDLPPITLKVNYNLDPGKIVIMVEHSETHDKLGTIIYNPQRGSFRVCPYGPDAQIHRPSLLGPGINGDIDFESHFMIAVSILLDNLKIVYQEHLEHVWNRYASFYHDEEDPAVTLLV